MMFIVIILILFFFSSPIQAQEFSVYQNSPVLKKDSKSAGVFQPFVSKKDNIFSIWFADSDGSKATIATMKSGNGIDWYDKKTLQLSNRNSVHDPFMFVKNNEHQLYFGSSNRGSISLWKSVSQDGVEFQKGSEHEILKAEYLWEGSHLSCPSVIEDKSLQYLIYAGSGGTEGWAIGMATSADGVSWQKCINNPIVPAGSGPHIVKYNNVFYLFYQSPAGLQVQQTTLLNGCNTVWSNKHSISPPFGDPAPLVVGNDLWLYGTFGTSEGQAIGLAGNVQITKPSYPIVLIPGMFASWNAQALLHNNVVPYDTWKLNKNVSEYDAIIKTFENKSWVMESDLYIFAYDWRKPIEETTENLDSFLTNKIWKSNPYQQVQIIGHSLGGVVGRIYADKNPTKLIKQIITAGSPHLGMVQAYKPLAAGEIDRENSLMWLAEKFILLLNKTGFQSDKETITQKMPVLFDVLPAFSFLKNESGTQITSTLTNTLTSSYPIKPSPPIIQIYLGGSGRQTQGGYVLGSRTPLDILFGSYGDGTPISSWTEDGDEVVLAKSALNQISPPPTQDHGELIYSKEGIKTIFSNLDIQIDDSEIPMGEATSIFPAILTFIQSPATMQITYDGTTTSENEGMLHLQDTADGVYTLLITGQSEGEYTVSIWLIGETDDQWIQFKKIASSGSKDVYTITFNGKTGGTAQEYIPPSPTPTPVPTKSPNVTPTPAISPTGIPQSSSVTSSQNQNNNNTSESTKVNTDIGPITNALHKITNSITNKKTTAIKKTAGPQILGAMNKKKSTYRFPFLEIFFIKQILWGTFTTLLTVFNKFKRMKNWLLKKVY